MCLFLNAAAHVKPYLMAESFDMQLRIADQFVYMNILIVSLYGGINVAQKVGEHWSTKPTVSEPFQEESSQREAL